MPLHHHRAGSGEPLVLVHGLASHWKAWRPVLPALEAEHEVVALDLPGFGSSPEDGTPATVEGQAGRVARFLDELGLRRPHVAGFSMGGGIALELARLGVVRTATAIAPVGFWTPRERAWCQRSLENAIRAGKLLRPALPALAASPVARTALLAQNFARPWRLSPEEVLETFEAATGATRFQACSDAFDAYTFHDADQLRGTPLTVAWGDRDRLLLSRQAGRAKAVLPFARHVTLRGCGHVPFRDDPEQVAQVVLAGARAPVAAVA